MRALWTVLALLVGCGPAVPPLAVGDPRLPPDSRRWIADAEDAVVAGKARTSDARAAVRAAERWQSRAEEAGAQLGGAAGALGALAQARVRFARSALSVAEAEQALAEARLVEAYAETAMRHDIAVYELEPINRRVATAREAVQQLRSAHQRERESLEATTNTWWTSWRQHASSGGQTKALWRELGQ